MTAVMQGVRILEVAEHTFVPAASALLADWGAEVIKIEHVERGDAMRGLAVHRRRADMADDVHVLLEHSNRGKQSLGLDLTSPDGLDILYKLAATSDVFLTNKLPERAHEAADRRRRHPGPQPEHHLRARHRPGRARAPTPTRAPTTRSRSGPAPGIALGRQAPRVRPRRRSRPAPGFGDSIGAMTIAGGIMGALFHRERTGEATIVDVSLLGTGLWAMGQAIALSLLLGHPVDGAAGRPACAPTRWSRNYDDQGRPVPRVHAASRPASTGRRCARSIGRPELATDPRFADHASLIGQQRRGAVEILARGVRRRDRSTSGATRLADFVGPVGRRAGHARGGGRPADRRQRLRPGLRDRRAARRSSSSPRRCSSTRSRRAPARAPEFNEHGDEILAELGLDWDTIVDLKVRGVVA